jgi:hypothetical protein
MKRLILTNNSSAAGYLRMAGLADVLIGLDRRFIWGPLPSDAELTTSFEAPKEQQRQITDQDYPPQLWLPKIGTPDLGLIDLCARFDTIELWIDPPPSDQLQLICLLHYLRPHNEIASQLILRQSDSEIVERLAKDPQWRPSVVKVRDDHFELASRAWRAFGALTPQEWFGLLAQDLGVLPRLRQAVVRLLEELPGRATGVGTTEMRMLKLISKPKMSPNGLFKELHKPHTRRVFDYWEIGPLLDGLARCPAPAMSGLEEGPFTLELKKERYKRYMRSQLSLTPLGKAILAGKDDFSRHNPIHRWWGGTELTNDRLWRWDPDNKALIAP